MFSTCTPTRFISEPKLSFIEKTPIEPVIVPRSAYTGTPRQLTQ